MKCSECGSDGAVRVQVEYTNGRSVKICLCGSCRGEYEDGGFVREMTPVE